MFQIIDLQKKSPTPAYKKNKHYYMYLAAQILRQMLAEMTTRLCPLKLILAGAKKHPLGD